MAAGRLAVQGSKTDPPQPLSLALQVVLQLEKLLSTRTRKRYYGLFTKAEDEGADKSRGRTGANGNAAESALRLGIRAPLQ